jgi:hypothetical protein
VKAASGEYGQGMEDGPWVTTNVTRLLLAEKKLRAQCTSLVDRGSLHVQKHKPMCTSVTFE